eukprot:PITA_29529
MAKVKQMILDGVRDYIVSHVAGKGTAKEMWDALPTLYQSSSKQQKMFFQEKLKSIRMQKGESIGGFLTRIQEVHDQLAVVGEALQPTELEELRRALLKSTISGSSNKGMKSGKEEENVALASKSPSQGHGEKKKKKDLSKVKCFRCGEFGHYNTQCPFRKKDKWEKQDRRHCQLK